MEINAVINHHTINSEGAVLIGLQFLCDVVNLRLNLRHVIVPLRHL